MRAEGEIKKNSVLLQKMNRTDIISGDASLTPADLENLGKLKDKQKKLAVSQIRIDSVLMMLRDF